MKVSKFVFAFAASVISLAAYSQQDSTKPMQQDSTKATVTEKVEATTSSVATQAQTNLPKANAGRHYIPVIGNYQSSVEASAVKNIVITVDESNPGKIWIEGLEPVKIYALLKAIPGTYKIPAQKAEDKSFAEGTLMYDESSKQVNVCIGCGYSDTNPAGAVAVIEPAATDKKIKIQKKTVLNFVGTKTDATAAR